MENKEFIQKLIKDLYKYAFGKLNSKENAEDVTSEVVARLIDKLKAEKLSSEATRMLAFGIAKNVLFEKYREETKISHEEVNEEFNLSDDESLEELVMKDEMIDLIKSELSTLDSATKDVLMLKIWEDLKFKEIADLHNTNENTIKTIYYKGLTSLKKQLEVKHGAKAYSFTIPSIILGLNLYGDAIASQLPSNFIASLVSAIPASLIIMFTNMTSPVAAASATAVSASQKGFFANFISTTVGKLVIGGVATTVALGTGVGGAVLVKNNIDSQNNDPVSYAQSDYELGQDNVEVSDPVEELETKEVEFCLDSFEIAPPNCLIEFTVQVPLDAQVSTSDGAGTPWPSASIYGEGYSVGIVVPYEAFEQELKEVVKINDTIFRGKFKSLGNDYTYSSAKQLHEQTSCLRFGETLAYPCGLPLVDYSEIGLALSCKDGSNVETCDEIIKNMTVKKKVDENVENKTVTLDSAEWFGTYKVEVTLPVEKGSTVTQPNPMFAGNGPTVQKTSAVIENDFYSINLSLPYEIWHTAYTSTHSLGLTDNGEIYRITTENSSPGTYIYTNRIQLEGQCGQQETFLTNAPCGIPTIARGDGSFSLACVEKRSGGLAKCEEAIKRMKLNVL